MLRFTYVNFVKKTKNKKNSTLYQSYFTDSLSYEINLPTTSEKALPTVPISFVLVPSPPRPALFMALATIG